jgi:hypothetical protein
MIERRGVLGGGAALAIGAALARPAAGQQHQMTNMENSMEDCIDLCIASHRMCLTTVNYAMKRGGALASPAMLAMLADCAELCQTTANSMLRGSPLHQVLCQACAEACARCADECSHHQADQQMVRCAQTCRTCAEGCRTMGAMGH